MALLSKVYDQSFRLAAPVLTEANLPDQSDRVFIVTGGYAGCGYELSKILYGHNATVYVAGRSAEKGSTAIANLKAAHPGSKGRLEFLSVDLQDLTTIKPAADAFLAKESRLDVLTNNAGVMTPPKGSKATQGYELQLATNVLGPFLFTELLTPILRKTAASSPPGSVRVTWAGSLGIEVMSPSPGGIVFEADGAPKCHGDQQVNYGQTKAANLLLSAEFARRYPVAESGVISNAWNPGNLKSELGRHMGLQMMFINLITHPPIYGAYTELFAGWSEEAGKTENNGLYIIPWGRFGAFRQDVGESLKSKAEGGSGKAAQLWEWCEKETRQYV